MTKRFYVCKIVGDGTEDNPFRPKVADHGVSWSGSIPVDENESSENYGKPLFDTCLVIASAVNHSPLRSDPDIESLPDFPLDGKVSSINTSTKNTMLQALQRRGFSTAGIDGTDGYRDALQSIGRQRDPKFDINNFDVAE